MITASLFGQTADGRDVTRFHLTSGRGLAVDVLDYGCVLQAITVTARDGRPVDVALGYDTLAEYEALGHKGRVGAIVGRWANRIPYGQLTIGGQAYALPINKPPHHTHGGVRSFDTFVWESEIRDGRLVLGRLSPDGEEGYPGNLRVSVTHEVTEAGELVLTYEARTDRDTVVNLTNHSYFNLEGGGDVLGHVLRLKADYFDEVSEEFLPTGRALPVAGTPFDFTSPKPLGRDINDDDEQLKRAGGYDHDFVIAGRPGPAAVLYAPGTGLAMEVSTTMPGVQLYTANSLTARPGKGTTTMGPRSGVCLETQYCPRFISDPALQPVLRPGHPYRHVTAFKFSA